MSLQEDIQIVVRLALAELDCQEQGMCQSNRPDRGHAALGRTLAVLEAFSGLLAACKAAVDLTDKWKRLPPGADFIHVDSVLRAAIAKAGVVGAPDGPEPVTCRFCGQRQDGVGVIGLDPNA